MKIRMRATFDEVEWIENQDDPIETEGYTNPNNPWGGLKVYPGDSSPHDEVWFENFPEALEFMKDFPGGIWGYSESESEQQPDGKWMSVTLHVETKPAYIENYLFQMLDRKKGI